MEGRLNVVVFMALIFVGAMLNVSSAQTTHVAGDSIGWTVPPGGDVAYRTWAATRTFVVGDMIVFNFTTGMHDVAEVTKESYDSCNANNPITMSTNGPTTITLTSAREYNFICTFGSHCILGQKLSINVSAASVAPSPQPTTPPAPAAPETTPSPAVPATPPPAASPAPTPMTYVVGDSLGWTVPPGGGPIAYRTWAMGKTFMVGDILVFNFTNAHDVAEVTRAEFDSCNISTTTTAPITTSPARITLSSAGGNYYICTITQHCSWGQKLAINVTAGTTGSAPAPSSTATPPSGSAPPPSSTITPPPSSGGSTPSTPSTPTPPPPPPSNSAPSFAVAALPFTFLAVAVALFN
ncbi:hypothetical protein ABFS83_10G112500 [Erythranthe nasuta]